MRIHSPTNPHLIEIFSQFQAGANAQTQSFNQGGGGFGGGLSGSAAGASAQTQSFNQGGGGFPGGFGGGFGGLSGSAANANAQTQTFSG